MRVTEKTRPIHMTRIDKIFSVLLSGMLGLVIVALLFVFMALTLPNFKKGLRDKGVEHI